MNILKFYKIGLRAFLFKKLFTNILMYVIINNIKNKQTKGEYNYESMAWHIFGKL